MKRSLLRDYLLVALPAKAALLFVAVGILVDEPLVVAPGVLVLVVVLLQAAGLWITNRRASRVDTDGEAQVFRYPALLTIGTPVAAWFSAFFWSVLFLIPGEGLTIWIWRFLGAGLIVVFSVGACRVTRACRSDFGEIRLCAEGIESRSRESQRRRLPWSEVVELSAAPYNGVGGHGVQVVGLHHTIQIYERIRGIRVLKRRLLRLAAEHGIPDTAVCWDRFGLITDADRIGR